MRCPWLLLGGVATSVCSADEMAVVDGARPGDVLMLTKVNSLSISIITCMLKVEISKVMLFVQHIWYTVLFVVSQISDQVPSFQSLLSR